MSKQSDAKASQGYRASPLTCSNCTHFTSDLKLPGWMRNQNDITPDRWKVESHGVEANKRCGIGGFSVKKTAVCSKHKEATS